MVLNPEKKLLVLDRRTLNVFLVYLHVYRNFKKNKINRFQHKTNLQLDSHLC